MMPNALPLSENMFGKMRGRFDEDAARAVGRTLMEEVFYGFLALDEGQKRELSARLAHLRKGGPGWRIDRTGA